MEVGVLYDQVAGEVMAEPVRPSGDLGALTLCICVGSPSWPRCRRATTWKRATSVSSFGV